MSITHDLLMKLTFVASLLIGFDHSTVALSQEQRSNHLAGESSQYLLQHSRNPVDWYPWGQEALAKAKSEGKLIFLSVGYSACHWCHVMEDESFSDEEIAAYLNEHYVCIKVDREERPDIDQIYMTAVELTAGQAGWPLSVFLTPDALPITGGSYFPPRDGERGFERGFLSVIQHVQKVWNDNRAGLLEQADQVTAAIRETKNQMLAVEQGDAPQLDVASLKKTLLGLQEQFDATYGGFQFSESQPQLPKFPEPCNLIYLMQVIMDSSHTEPEKESARTMLFLTLDSMLQGGIYDHLAGGFHRYSTDRYWNVPHFEKMLYDQALLAWIYSSAYQLSRNQEYRRVAIETSEFVIREMRGQDLLFYASIDADVEGQEGEYYIWRQNEIVVAKQKIVNFDQFASRYGLSGKPNFESDGFILRMDAASLATRAKGTEHQFDDKELDTVRAAMLAIRNESTQPLSDKKAIVSWNALMIAALADVSKACGRADFLDAASKSLRKLKESALTADGKLMHIANSKQSASYAYLDDYACLILALNRMHAATGERSWFDEALHFQQEQDKLFRSDDDRGYYFTSTLQPEVILRYQDPVDGALPSGPSVTASNFLYFLQHGSDAVYKPRFERLIEPALILHKKSPTANPLMVASLLRWISLNYDE